MAGNGSRPPREQTDSRLKAERGKTDKELSRKTKVVENDADKVVRAARGRAANVLRTARERADNRTSSSKAPRSERGAAEEERILQDEVLREQYAHADKVVTGERGERARLLTELLSREREDTDLSLLLERVDADAILGRRDAFLGMVSHDLRNELSGISFSVGQILGHVADDDGARTVFRSATNIQRINVRMSRLIGNLLDVVSIDVGTFTVLPKDRDVSTTVDQIVESFVPIASAKGISLTVTGTSQSLAARFDNQRIQQVLGTLLTNALKYTSEDGRVAVSAERKRGEVWFTVADSGSGIAAGRLESIFDRFSRGADPGRKGLGLYIARHIVEAHGGRIWAKSAPGRGSTFHFTLPLPPARRGAMGRDGR